MNKGSLLLGLVLLVGTTVSAETKSDLLLHPDRTSTLAELKGQIQSIDTTTSHLTVKDSHQLVTVLIKQDTRIMDTENNVIALTSLHTDAPVIIYYNVKEKSAVEVDLQPTVVNAVLGTPVEEHK